MTIYEARDRIGGRVWTDRAWGLPVDLGASWIHGVRRNPLTALADAAGLKRVATEPLGLRDTTLHPTAEQRARKAAPAGEFMRRAGPGGR